MANPVDLTKQPVFYAREIEVDKNKMVVVAYENGKDKACSYYTTVTLNGPITDISTLKQALSEAVEKLGRKGE
jgi:hypothetical protein